MSTHSSTHSSTSTHGLSSYSPIQTLEQQYSTQPCLQLFVRTNANCCLAGGVEALFKLQHNTTTQNSTSSHSVTSNTPTGTNSDDPFAFLQQDESSASSERSAVDTSSSIKKKGGIGSWAKSVAKKSASHLERGMTGLAIRADGGKNPDLLVCALRDSFSGLLLGMTEAQPLPTEEKERLQGCWFAIPLLLPVTTTTTSVTLSLYIKSGASFIMGTKGKHYLLGSIVLDTAELQTSLERQQQYNMTTTLSLQSQVVVDGQVTLCIVGDSKFPLLLERGWSVTDPDTSGYTNKGLYHLPLHQSYGYSVGKRWFLGMERAVESSVVLPIATAFQQVASKASIVSLNHAQSVDKRLYEYRHDSMNIPGNKSQVTLSLGYLFVGNNAARACSVSVHWQRPDSMFEVELLSGNNNIGMQQEHSTFQPTVNASFAPPVISSQTEILPTILALYNGGASLPPFLLGNVRLAFRISTTTTSNGSNPFDNVGTTTCTLSNYIPVDEEYWQAVIPLEAYVGQQAGPVQIPGTCCVML